MQTIRLSVTASLVVTVLVSAGLYLSLQNRPLADSSPSTAVIATTAATTAQVDPVVPVGLLLLVLLTVLVLIFVAVYLSHRPKHWREANERRIVNVAVDAIETPARRVARRRVTKKASPRRSKTRVKRS